MSGEVDELNYRERATLNAVARGNAQLSCSSEPDLFIDGIAVCDQSTAHHLARRGYITPQRSGRQGERVPAQLTDAGRLALAAIGATRSTRAA